MLLEVCKALAIAGAITLGLSWFMQEASADVVTEFGFGYKVSDTTSFVLQERCHTAEKLKLANGEIFHHGVRSCGGDNPLFIGWPIAYEHEFDGPWTVRAGWFHMSHWFDGGADREVHMDAAVVSFKFNWSDRKRD